MTPQKKRKAVPYDFVLEELEALRPRTKPMFGCLAVYVEEKIVLILRERHGSPADNGVCAGHHRSAARQPAARFSQHAVD